MIGVWNVPFPWLKYIPRFASLALRTIISFLLSLFKSAILIDQGLFPVEYDLYELKVNAWHKESKLIK